jgi:signal peptidase I
MVLKIIKAVINFFLDFVEMGVFALVVFVITYLFLFQPHQVKGNSMYPNYHDGEYLLTNKLSYRFGNPKRGEVIIFKAPKNEDYDYIKRIIALPGEKIKVSQGLVYVNNKAVIETDYLSDQIKTQAGLFLSEEKELTVGEGEYFVLGDNRSHSSDSRDWGTVPEENIIGKAWFRYWPLSKIGILKKASYP